MVLAVLPLANASGRAPIGNTLRALAMAPFPVGLQDYVSDSDFLNLSFLDSLLSTGSLLSLSPSFSPTVSNFFEVSCRILCFSGFPRAFGCFVATVLFVIPVSHLFSSAAFFFSPDVLPSRLLSLAVALELCRGLSGGPVMRLFRLVFFSSIGQYFARRFRIPPPLR